ncbi:MAG: ATP phosphoribosyltransferase [Opitutaceae bacterium]|nr:ATP phosphoribosyltransferase [Opitutaceae bacterium]
MLRIAIPNKGSLSEGAVAIATEAGYSCKRSGRELSVVDAQHDIEFIYLRPRDIAIYVGNGTLDLGLTGRDLSLDSEASVEEILSLGFGASRFFYALPKEKALTPDQFMGMRIATSYPSIVKADMKSRGVDVTVVELDGAVEISIRLGVADAIADVVESGRTLKEAGLVTVGDPIMNSEAILIAHNKEVAASEQVQTLINRFRGVLTARQNVMIEYDIARENLDTACDLTPGVESPTIAPLSRDGWVAVKSLIARKGINGIMDALQKIGAKGIIVSDIKSCRL